MATPVAPVTVVAVSTSSLCVLGDYAGRPHQDKLRVVARGDTFGEVVMLPGGSAANVSVWAARAGTSVTFIGKIGRDQMGMLAREELVPREWSIG